MKSVILFCVAILLLAGMAGAASAFTCKCRGIPQIEYDWKGQGKTVMQDCGNGFAAGKVGDVRTVNLISGLYDYLEGQAVQRLEMPGITTSQSAVSGWVCSQ